MRGYIIIENKKLVIESDIYESVKKLIHDEFFDIKDSKWDCDDRHKIKWHIVNLSNGKNKLLKGWKTSYKNDSVEDTNSNWYTKTQIKALERSLK